MKFIRPTLWFDKNAMEAAEFYVNLFPDSRIDNVLRSPADNPSTGKGEIVVVEFSIFDREFAGINGGPRFQLNESFSIDVACDGQEEVDFYWDKLTSNGGKASRCGWCRDRFGLWWQVTPTRLREMMMSPDPDAAERVMVAMLSMGKIEIQDLEKAFNGD